MSRILLVRHGATNWNLAGRLQGHADLSLNSHGFRQAAALAARLKQETIDSIISSDLKRARQTAKMIACDHNLPVTNRPELRELHFGDWEGLTYAAIEASDPQAVQAWSDDLLNFSPPGGESLAQMADRVAGVLEEQRGLPEGHHRLIVAHGGPLQVLVCMALGLPPERYWQFQLATGSLSQLSLYPAGAILDYLNDRHHLVELL